MILSQGKIDLENLDKPQDPEIKFELKIEDLELEKTFFKL